MVKPRSQQQPAKRKSVDPKAADTLANTLADKPYGQTTGTGNQDTERLTIALPQSLYDQVEALAKKRRRAKAENRSMSAITREALREYLRKHNS